MKWKDLALLTAAIVCQACGATSGKPPSASASGVGAPSADFAKYETFTFGPANPPVAEYSTTARSLEVQRRLTPLVEASLEKRGYAESPERADLVIKISAGSGTQPGDKVQRGNSAAETPVGFISIDAYDRQTGVSIWHGTAFAEVDPERIDDALLARGVEHMLAQFPARRE